MSENRIIVDLAVSRVQRENHMISIVRVSSFEEFPSSYDFNCRVSEFRGVITISMVMWMSERPNSAVQFFKPETIHVDVCEFSLRQNFTVIRSP